MDVVASSEAVTLLSASHLVPTSGELLILVIPRIYATILPKTVFLKMQLQNFSGN